MGDSPEHVVRAVVARFGKAVGDVDLDAPIEEVVDSLELSVLVATVEKHFGIALDNRAVGRVRVVRDLVREVEKRISPPGARP